MFQKISFNDKTTVPDVFSYGKTTGNYVIDKKFLTKVATDETMLKKFCLVPKKTEYYNMIWDFDFKFDKCPELAKHSKEEDINNIMEHILDIIIIKLKETFIITDNDLKYVYAIKNIGSGVHIYFPNIIVNKQIHHYIYTKTLEMLQEENYLTPTLLKHIFDSCVSKANGLRMFHFYNGDNFYYPCPLKSTYVFDKDPSKNILLSYTNTKERDVRPKLSIDIEEIKNKIHNVNIKKKTNDKKNDIIKNDIEYVEDFAYMEKTDKINMFLELADILDSARLDNYDTWIQIVFLFRTYELKQECINYSKKSNKYDDKARSTIRNIFNRKTLPNTKCLTIGSLIYWYHKDNFMKTRKILEKYDNDCCFMGLNLLDDILLHENTQNINYSEDCKYISENAQAIISDALFKKNKDVCILKAPTGSGKTTAIKNILENIDKSSHDKQQMLSVITRRSLAACHKNAFNYSKSGKNKKEKVKNKHLQFVSYLDNYMIGSPHFISSLEHLRFCDSGYNVLIIDELNSLINYFYSDTLDGIRKECLDRLLYLIKNADFIIACDMHITDACFKLFEGKNIFFYVNTFKNKKDIKMNIYYATHSSENSCITKIADIIGNKYAKHHKPVLIFSDRKKTTIKLLELLKQYNNDDRYFVLIHAECGSQDDIEKLDELSKTKCIICSPRIIYGIDLSSYTYDDIYCIYSHTSGEEGLSAFHWYQQLSRSRQHKQVNIFILDAFAKKHKLSFRTFDKCKAEEDKLIDHHMVFMKNMQGEHKIVDTLVANKSPIFRNIHYYYKWYNYIFSGNKCTTLKLIAKEAGYIIKEIEFECDKIKTELETVVKQNKELMNELSHKIINNEPIDDIHKAYADNLAEKIDNKKKYVDKKNPEYADIVCDDKLFKGYMNKKLLDMSHLEFTKELVKINNNEHVEVLKDNILHKKISELFWLEDLLVIKRYEIEKLKDCDYKTIANTLKDNKKRLIIFYNEDGRSAKYANARMTKILDRLDSSNKIQKWLADIYNSIALGTIKYEYIKIRTKNGLSREYIFHLVKISKIKENNKK